MTVLIVGSDPTPILDFLPPSDPYLFIDSGPLIAEIIPPIRAFNLSRHSFNPLKDISVRRARELVAAIEATAPGGENTLSYRYARDELLDRILAPSRYQKKLATLFREEPSKKDTGAYDAYLKIKDLMRSPLLERVLNGTTVFPKGRVALTLDPAEIGSYDAYVLGNFALAQYPNTIVVPHFEFYASRHHRDLIREGRLIAGITSFADVPTLANELMQVPERYGSRALSDDAEILAMRAGWRRGSTGFETYVHEAMRRLTLGDTEISLSENGGGDGAG